MLMEKENKEEKEVGRHPDLRRWGPPVGRSEKYKSQNFEKVEEDSGPRHSTDFRTVFGIMIGQISSC